MSIISSCKKIVNGKSCLARPLKGKSYCYWHDPARVADRRRASSRGGDISQNRQLLTLDVDSKLSDILADTLGRVRRVRSDGSIDNKAAYLVGFLSDKLIAARKFELEMEKYSKPIPMESAIERLYHEDPDKTVQQLVDVGQQFLENRRRMASCEPIKTIG